MDYFTRREEQDLTIKEPPKQELEQIVEKEAEQEVENEAEWEDDLAEFYMNVRKLWFWLSESSILTNYFCLRHPFVFKCIIDKI